MYPMTQDELLTHAEYLQTRVNMSLRSSGHCTVEVQRFGDDTSPFYLITIKDLAMNQYGGIGYRKQAFKINIASGDWEVFRG